MKDDFGNVTAWESGDNRVFNARDSAQVSEKWYSAKCRNFAIYVNLFLYLSFMHWNLNQTHTYIIAHRFFSCRLRSETSGARRPPRWAGFSIAHRLLEMPSSDDLVMLTTWSKYLNRKLVYVIFFIHYTYFQACKEKAHIDWKEEEERTKIITNPFSVFFLLRTGEVLVQFRLRVMIARTQSVYICGKFLTRQACVTYVLVQECASSVFVYIFLIWYVSRFVWLCVAAPCVDVLLVRVIHVCGACVQAD